MGTRKWKYVLAKLPRRAHYVVNMNWSLHPMFKSVPALALGLTLAAGGLASAAPVVDGIFSAGEYGAASAVVAHDPAAPTGNFQTPTAASNTIGYSIFLNHTGATLYGLLQTNSAGGGASGGAFANLYFDLDPRNGNGSDLGFEVGNLDAFIPGVAGSVATPEVAFKTSAGGSVFEFSIPDSDFIAPIPGLNYGGFSAFPDGANPNVTLRLSQSFGFSVAGGASFGTNRLGTFAVAAIPEPATMVLLGIGLLGIAAVRRRPHGV